PPARLWSVVYKVEDYGLLARRKRPAKEVLADFPTDAAFPAESFQIEKVVNKDWFAFLQEEAVAAEPAAQRHDHSFRTAFGNSNLGGDGEVFVQNVGSIAERNPGVLTRVGELRFTGDRARSRRLQAHKCSVIQRQDVVLRRFRQKQRLHFLEFAGIFVGEVVVLREVFGDVVELPLVAVNNIGQ